MAQQRNEIVLARFSQGQCIPYCLRFCRAGFRVRVGPGHRERRAGEVREAGQDSAVLGVKQVPPVVRHHPQGAPGLRFPLRKSFSHTLSSPQRACPPPGRDQSISSFEKLLDSGRLAVVLRLQELLVDLRAGLI